VTDNLVRIQALEVQHVAPLLDVKAINVRARMLDLYFVRVAQRLCNEWQ